MHGDKTRLIRFGRFAAAKRTKQGQGKPETFGFLGFTHICRKTRNGGFLLLRHTRSQRLRAKLGQLRTELTLRRHRPLMDQGRWLQAVLRGYNLYHGVPTNIHAVARFRTELARSWHRSLRRRSQKRRLTWERMNRHVQRWLPPAHICHPWPWERFDARTRDKSRVQ